MNFYYYWMLLIFRSVKSLFYRSVKSLYYNCEIQNITPWILLANQTLIPVGKHKKGSLHNTSRMPFSIYCHLLKVLHTLAYYWLIIWTNKKTCVKLHFLHNFFGKYLSIVIFDFDWKNIVLYSQLSDKLSTISSHKIIYITMFLPVQFVLLFSISLCGSRPNAVGVKENDGEYSMNPFYQMWLSHTTNFQYSININALKFYISLR